MKISWNPNKGQPKAYRADGSEYCIGTGHAGTYERVGKDGLWAAYFYPGGVQTSTPVVLLPPGSSGTKAYLVCVEHNKASV